MEMISILVLCTHNSARSQMAEGILRAYSRNIEVFSAGTEATFVKENAIKVMQEIGIDISSHTSKSIDSLPEGKIFDYVIKIPVK